MFIFVENIRDMNFYTIKEKNGIIDFNTKRNHKYFRDAKAFCDKIITSLSDDENYLIFENTNDSRDSLVFSTESILTRTKFYEILYKDVHKNGEYDMDKLVEQLEERKFMIEN